MLFPFRRTYNPGTFYASTNYDWTTPQNDALWRDEVKTLFDPCPAGWRVPNSGDNQASIWQSFDPTQGVWPYIDTRAGYQWGYPTVKGAACGWFPATGYRVLSGHFSGCTVWIHIRSSNSRVFRVSSSDFTPDASNTHTSGFSIRCIRE